MKHKLIEKAYWVGSRWDIKNLGHPECGAELIHIEKGQKASKAKQLAKMVKYNDDIESYLDIYAIREKSNDLYEYNGKTATMYSINDDILTNQYRENIKKIAEEYKGKNCYIYSNQWNSYWRTNSAGYTTDIRQVGIYTVEEAVQIALGCDFTKGIEIQII